MSFGEVTLISEMGFAAARRELGSALPRILSYYRQDGVVSVTAIETAMAARDASAMVLPAHSLKGESQQLGAQHVAEMSEHLEMTARKPRLAIFTYPRQDSEFLERSTLGLGRRVGTIGPVATSPLIRLIRIFSVLAAPADRLTHGGRENRVLGMVTSRHCRLIFGFVL